jgi:urea transporter
MRDYLKPLHHPLLTSVLNSYSVVFFFNNRLLGFVLLVVTFFNLPAGLCGLISVLTTVLIAGSMGFDKTRINQGIYSFNALLTGLGIGTFFEPGSVFLILLLLAVLVSLMLSVILSSWFGKYGLPFLSIPFVFSFWLVLLPSGNLANLGLTQRNVFWMNEMYSVGGKGLLDFFQTVDSLPLSRTITIYLRSLSSIIFQDNLLTGICIAISLLLISRITFLLSIAGFVTAYLFARFIGADVAGFSFYNIGANYILVAIAAGGFFTIPSKHSFLWVVILVPLTSLLILFMTKVMGPYSLPFFSLPFSIVVISFLYFLILRVKPGKPVLTPYQYYSPEVNLYSYRGNADRLIGSLYFPIHLPFWGEWTVSQGHDGEFTHKGEWANAIDFVLTDEKGNTHEGQANSCEDYFCYNKPVIAPADGIVAELTDYVDDNEPGKVNTSQNWGNTVVIKHTNTLFSQVSHLKTGTLKIKKGDFIRKGEIIGLCGNSGRSPEPHIHFQAQSTPLQGAKTISYPFAYYLRKSEGKPELKSFSIPNKGECVSNVMTSMLFRQAFDLQPGIVIKFRYLIDNQAEKTAVWEVFTDYYNNKYLYCSETQSLAYFVNDGTMFYFTSFYGNRKSLLYYFYLSAYKVLLGYYENLEITDHFPLHVISGNTLSLWIHDFLAPFYQYIKASYTIRTSWSDSTIGPEQVRLASEMKLNIFSAIKEQGTGSLFLSENSIKEFSFSSDKAKVWAQRINI